jgi:SNF2 family DNA or RNA helicase
MVFAEWPRVSADVRRPCGACQSALAGVDAVEFDVNAEAPPEASSSGGTASAVAAKKKGQKIRAERRQRGLVPDNFHASTKIKALLGDLVDLSRLNPHSANYDPDSAEIQMVDAQGNDVSDGPVKTIVFSQWTTMLDKIEDALELANIRFERLDGTMKRDDRVKAMDALKYDPRCEVLLVSLKAGGVGLNLTAASRVYLMDPYWNPAVENQAVDRVHRLGQTRPVVTIKFIIENTIEDRLLKVQKRKEALANMTLGQGASKAEVVQRRLDELRALFDF